MVSVIETSSLLSNAIFLTCIYTVTSIYNNINNIINNNNNNIILYVYIYI